MYITIEINLKIVDFLDVYLDLTNDKFFPYKKPNDVSLYIHQGSNHPPNVLKQIPIMTSMRLSNLSCNEAEFDKAAAEYQDTLKNSGFTEKLRYHTKQSKSKQRKRNVLWYNPPYDLQVKTDVGRKFLNLLTTHFPLHHRLHKILNKNTVKVSYSCMTNLLTHISSHNINTMNKHRSFETIAPPSCNCINRENCPLDGKCLSKAIIYKGEISVIKEVSDTSAIPVNSSSTTNDSSGTVPDAPNAAANLVESSNTDKLLSTYSTTDIDEPDVPTVPAVLYDTDCVDPPSGSFVGNMVSHDASTLVASRHFTDDNTVECNVTDDNVADNSTPDHNVPDNSAVGHATTDPVSSDVATSITQDEESSAAAICSTFDVVTSAAAVCAAQSESPIPLDGINSTCPTMTVDTELFEDLFGASDEEENVTFHGFDDNAPDDNSTIHATVEVCPDATASVTLGQDMSATGFSAVRDVVVGPAIAVCAVPSKQPASVGVPVPPCPVDNLNSFESNEPLHSGNDPPIIEPLEVTAPVSMTYIGLCEPPFKGRYADHKTSFSSEKYRSKSELSKAIWDIKDKGQKYILKFSIAHQSTPFRAGSKHCNLCLWEKLYIMKGGDNIINKHDELISKCRHINKFLFKYYK